MTKEKRISRMQERGGYGGFIKVNERSIARRLTISLFLLVIIVEGILLTVLYATQAKLLRQELETKADDYADYLAEILVVPVWDFDDEQIEKIGAGFTQNELVNELHIYNSEQHTLYSYQDEDTADDRIKRTATIDRNGKSIGIVEFHLSLGAFQSTLVLIRNSMTLVLATSLIVILITTGLLLHYFIRNPIDSLQKGLDRVAKGDYQYDFHDVHYTELSGISMRIKEMAHLIEQRERSLYDMNKELKQEISTRKREASEKIKLEKKLQQANKMEAIGTLAGGVAHDLNNILSGIVAYPDLILLQLPNDSPLHKPISAIKTSGLKAAAIVQDLLTLARRGVAARELVNLNTIVSQYLKSPEYNKLKSFHPDVTVTANLGKGLLNTMGSPIHLSKTIMNLISNAAEAMPDGGTITVSTENRYIEKPVDAYGRIEEGDYAVLTISDTGVGIPAEEKERIFEPFYTKKVMGRSGTGLGMAVVWGTVEDHGGSIDVQSTVGWGTTFSLSFPATRQQDETDKAQPPLESYRGNGEVVLVVDDLESQRDIAAAILSNLGYAASAVSNGSAAVDFVKDRNVDLLVLDMIMEPGMDGLETYRQIIEIRPGQKAIIASGFSETDRVKEAQRLGAGEYLKKPYTLENLGIAVKKELGQHPSSQ
jgi:signal transduction histidine kinase/ActR/RegA family two-component response regulator